MPKPPPYYARITFRVTVTKFLRTSDTVQADYDYAYGQEAMRHFGTFRMPDGLGSGSLEGLLHATESMIKAHVRDCYKIGSTDAELEPPDDPGYPAIVED